MNKYVVGMLLIVLSCFLVIKGIVPAFSKIDTDFPNYYTAGFIARTGTDITKLYDDSLFQQHIYELKLEQQGKFSPFPPATAIFFVPFSYLTPIVAMRWLTALNGLGLLISIWLTHKIFDWSFSESAVYILLSGIGLSNCFRFGQLYILVSASMLASLYFSRRHRYALGGIVSGILAPVKYFPAVLTTSYILRKKWSSLAGFVCSTILVVGTSIALLGWEVHATFVQVALGNHLQSNLSGQDPFSSTYQSFDSLLRRLFVSDPVLNPNPYINSWFTFFSLKIAVVAVVLVVCAYAIGRLRPLWMESDMPMALVSVAVLLVAPATATYHFLLLWLPIGIFLSAFRSQRSKTAALLTLSLYAAIGFVPYSYFRQFEGNDLVTLLAYPRLWLLVGLFAVGVYASLSMLKFDRKMKLNSALRR